MRGKRYFVNLSAKPLYDLCIGPSVSATRPIRVCLVNKFTVVNNRVTSLKFDLRHSGFVFRPPIANGLGKSEDLGLFVWPPTLLLRSGKVL